MNRPTFMIAASLVAGCLLSLPGATAANKPAAPRSDPAAATIEKVLRAEVAGPVDRRKELAPCLEAHSDSKAARWQAGFFENGHDWRSFDDSKVSAAETPLQKQYQQRRDECAQTFASQCELANWCRSQRLFDEERVHLLASLNYPAGPNQPEVLQRLGFQQVGPRWVSPEEFREWETIVKKANASLKKWSGKLEKIATRLEGTAAQRGAALAELQAIKDPAAIPAIEYGLAGRDANCGRAAIDVLRKMESPEASAAIARQSVFSAWPEVRQAALAALGGRPLEDFVPSLISLLATPAGTEFRMAYDPARAGMVFSYVMATETENQFQLKILDVVSPVVFVRIIGAGPLPQIDNTVRGAPARRVTVDRFRNVRDQVYVREDQRESENERIQDLNKRLITVLASVSGLEPSADARQWWQWWHDFTDAPPSGSKSVVVSEETVVSVPTYIPIRTHSCFAAGTPVWTENGAVPIESIKIGAKVLSKDIETGELDYRPVLQTTANPPRDLMTVRFGDETIVCTKGHRFWESGNGWIKARDLSEQTLLHTVTGNTPVWTARKGETAETYNLVVADFHTYFVGKTGVLCQDLLPPQRTNKIVPGLARTQAAAK